MQLPFKLEDVRLVCVDGDKIRFVLPKGHVEIVLDERQTNRASQLPPLASRLDSKHIMFEDGIYGI